MGRASGREVEMHSWSWLGRLKEDHLVGMGVDDRTVLNMIFLRNWMGWCRLN